MAKKQFKAESKRLLDLMVNSIYTHKEIFLRGAHFNASDAEDKLAYKAHDDQVPVDRSELKITIVPDKEMRTLTVSDNGVGMSKEDLESNLGTIAKSGPSSSSRTWPRRTSPRTSTSSASSAWASTPPLWWPTTSPSSPRPTAVTRLICGSPTGPTVIPSPSARRTP